MQLSSTLYITVRTFLVLYFYVYSETRLVEIVDHHICEGNDKEVGVMSTCFLFVMLHICSRIC